MDRGTLTRERLTTYDLPAYEPKRNRANRYGFDAAEQKTGTFAGVGYDFNVHDTMIIEGAGAIQDRTKEHLGYTDRPIIAGRRQLLAAARDDAKLVLARDLELTGPRGPALRVLLYLFERDAAVRLLRSG